MAGKERKRQIRKKHQRQKHKLSHKAPLVSDNRLNEYAVRHRAVKLSQIISAYPQDIAYGLARKDEAGWHFGRLYLVGAIDLQQYSASKDFDRTVRQYKRMLHRYPDAFARNYEHVGGGSSEDLSEPVLKRCVNAYERFFDLYNKLDECGLEVKDALFAALEKDAIIDLELLRRGLDALSKTSRSRNVA